MHRKQPAVAGQGAVYKPYGFFISERDLPLRIRRKKRRCPKKETPFFDAGFFDGMYGEIW